MPKVHGGDKRVDPKLKPVTQAKREGIPQPIPRIAKPLPQPLPMASLIELRK